MQLRGARRSPLPMCRLRASLVQRIGGSGLPAVSRVTATVQSCSGASAHVPYVHRQSTSRHPASIWTVLNIAGYQKELPCVTPLSHRMGYTNPSIAHLNSSNSEVPNQRSSLRDSSRRLLALTKAYSFYLIISFSFA